MTEKNCRYCRNYGKVCGVIKKMQEFQQSALTAVSMDAAKEIFEGIEAKLAANCDNYWALEPDV